MKFSNGLLSILLYDDDTFDVGYKMLPFGVNMFVNFFKKKAITRILRGRKILIICGRTVFIAPI